MAQSRDALVTRRIADEPVVLYRKLDADIVAMEDRCCHRQAPLSPGKKEGNDIRCGYHGIKFGPMVVVPKFRDK
ncbi:MAG: Rieske 2Fe-2S domain-containing protein [Gammaproteobacteria bacterium]